MSAQHHPEVAHLLDYASGTAGEAVSLLVVTHLSLCAECRDTLRLLESLGAQALETPPAPGLIPLPADLPPQDPAPRRLSVPASAAHAPLFPRALQAYTGGDADAIAWRPLLFGIADFTVPGIGGDAEVKLLRIPAGAAMPVHTHDGLELTLVLQGAFSDQTGHYARGDVAVATPELEHRPRAAPGDPCICLTVVEAPLRFTGPVARIVQALSPRRLFSATRG